MLRAQSLLFVLLIFGLVQAGSFVAAGESASTPGTFKLDYPTTVALGVSWVIQGDDNENAVVSLHYRKKGDEEWKQGYPLLRAYDGNAPKKIKSPQSYFFKVNVPKGSWRFAGSVWGLESGTAYELKVSLKDPDGGDEEKVVSAKTLPIPPETGGGRTLYVAAEGGDGDGSKESPFVGLASVGKNIKPGDTFNFLPGEFRGTLKVARGGKPGKPVVFRKDPDSEGEAVINAGGKTGVYAGSVDHVTIDGFTIKNCKHGLQGNGAGNLTIRRCNITFKGNGILAKMPRKHHVQYLYVADNIFSGPSTWPRSKGIEPTGGIDIAGYGHTIRNNKISGVADGISMSRSPGNSSCDIFQNEISECTDDGVETDYSDFNIRVYENRLTNVYQAMSCQPVKGGPVYFFRNAIYNVGENQATIKLHNYCSGVLFFHNTSVKKGTAFHSGTREIATNAHFFNNLFIGKREGKGLVVNFGTELKKCSFDYNGAGGEGFNSYMRWNKKWMPPLNKLKEAGGPVQAHGHFFKTDEVKLFAKDVKIPEKVETQFKPEVNDLQLDEKSPAIDQAKAIPGINDGFKGKAPDLGAYEYGVPAPHYGPSPVDAN